MSFRPQATDVPSSLQSPEQASLLANAEEDHHANVNQEGSYVPPSIETENHIPTAVSANVPSQIRMGGALHKSGFHRSDVVTYSGQDWEIVGEDSQILLVRLSPGQEVMIEPGGMMTKKSSTVAEVHMGDSVSAFKRCCFARESCFRVIWKPTEADVVTITPYFPSKVLPIDLSKYSGLNIKKKAWMASIGRNTEFDAALAPNLGTACCAGQGCVISSVRGAGMAFLNVGGTVVERQLAEGEQLVLDDSSLVAWERTVKLDVVRAGGVGMMCCGGQGLFNASLTGPGLVIVQSMSFEKARTAYMAAARGFKPRGGVSIASEIV